MDKELYPLCFLAHFSIKWFKDASGYSFQTFSFEARKYPIRILEHTIVYNPDQMVQPVKSLKALSNKLVISSF